MPYVLHRQGLKREEEFDKVRNKAHLTGLKYTRCIVALLMEKGRMV